jgi:hypothetical protein
MNVNVRPCGEIEEKLLEYLREVRQEVCSRCSGRPVGDPRGNPCGVELPLAQLVEAMQIASAGGPTQEGDSQPFGPGPAVLPPDYVCPCPMDRLATLAAEAAEDLDRRHQQREHLLNLWNND